MRLVTVACIHGRLSLIVETYFCPNSGFNRIKNAPVFGANNFWVMFLVTSAGIDPTLTG